MDFSKSKTTHETHGITERNIASTRDLEWQVDSEWIDLSSGSATPSGNKRENKSKSTPPKDSPKFYFSTTSNGGRFLIIDQQTFRQSQKTTLGYSRWVCNIPCCSAQCILEPAEKKMIRYSQDHNHASHVSRVVYKNFINALKIAVKENPHVKPKALYQKEFQRLQDTWEENGMHEELSLPDFDDVSTAMNNTRNEILSLFALRPTEENKNEQEKPPSKGPSRSTRSRDNSSEGKKKSSPSKSSAQNPSDLEELEDAWASQSHQEASLSDFEEWLDDDLNANISPDLKNLSLNDTVSGNSAETSFDTDLPVDNDGDLWSTTIPLDKIPRRKYRKRPASLSVFTCTHCPYKSNRHFNVQRHERLAHSSKKPEFNCKECGTSYSLEYRLKLHIKAVHQGEGHHCPICSRTFETMTGLKSHLVTKHKNDDPKVKRELPAELTCKLCHRVFTTKAHLMKHTNTHVMVQPYRCYACNQPFLDECTWLTHQNNCNEAFTIQCCLCSSIIPSAHELLAHMDEVHGRAEYSCNCGKSFPWKKSLLTHQQKCSLFMAEKALVS